MTYLVNEIFTSIKGEGCDIGKRATFVRFYGCNFDCEWCDSKYSRQGADFRQMTDDEILTEIPKGMPLTITGGEPCLHDLKPFIKKWLRREGRSNQTEIETNGSIFKKWHYVDWTVSPKLQFMTDDYLDTLQKFENVDAVFKFVIGTRKDYDYTIDFMNALEMSRVVFMPKGITKQEILDTSNCIAQWMLDEKEDISNVQLIPRLHILLWDNERGR